MTHEAEEKAEEIKIAEKIQKIFQENNGEFRDIFFETCIENQFEKTQNKPEVNIQKEASIFAEGEFSKEEMNQIMDKKNTVQLVKNEKDSKKNIERYTKNNGLLAFKLFTNKNKNKYITFSDRISTRGEMRGKVLLANLRKFDNKTTLADALNKLACDPRMMVKAFYHPLTIRFPNDLPKKKTIIEALTKLSKAAILYMAEKKEQGISNEEAIEELKNIITDKSIISLALDEEIEEEELLEALKIMHNKPLAKKITEALIKKDPTTKIEMIDIFIEHCVKNITAELDEEKTVNKPYPNFFKNQKPFFSDEAGFAQDVRKKVEKALIKLSKALKNYMANKDEESSEQLIKEVIKEQGDDIFTKALDNKASEKELLQTIEENITDYLEDKIPEASEFQKQTTKTTIKAWRSTPKQRPEILKNIDTQLNNFYKSNETRDCYTSITEIVNLANEALKDEQIYNNPTIKEKVMKLTQNAYTLQKNYEYRFGYKPNIDDDPKQKKTRGPTPSN